MSDESIVMYHPDTEGIAETRASAFEKVWQHKGWVRLDESTNKISRERLLELAAEREVDVSGAKTKADIASALTEGDQNNG